MTLRNEDTRTARVALAAAFLFILAAALGRCGAEPSPALAQAPGRPRWHRTPEETLAALCVNEAGWDSPGDCAAIYAVLANRAEREGVTWLRFMSWYSPRFWAGTGRNPWTYNLRDSDAYPEGLGASWGREREGGLASRRLRFQILVAFCREAMHTPPVCAAMDWGSVEDYATGPYARAHRHDVFPVCGEGLLMLYSARREEADPD